ncbi:MAG TPA: hypothetical protein VIK73_09620 [Limnochordales bacterium]
MGQREHGNEWRPWMVVYGRADGVEGYALREIVALLQGHLERPAAVREAASTGEELLRQHNLLVIGTAASNPLVAELARKGLTRIETETPEHRAVHVLDSPWDPDLQMAVVTGSDSTGVLWAARDFEHYVVDPATRINGAGKVVRAPFRDRFEPVSFSGAPAIQHRGLWTWGHVIYDWQRYLDHMSRWKLNTVVIWNDFCPVNANEIVSYAHTRGIRVFWGYSWGWGEEVDPTSKEETDRWATRVVGQYRDAYHATRCDGIYFQIFTETLETEMRGRPIAELAVAWVNTIAERLLAEYPGLRLLFGLHATSVRGHEEALAGVRPDVAIIWEDVGGPPPPFPYAYDPDVVDGVHQAIAQTGRIARLRSPHERMGIVVKGMTNLDWESFEHQPGSLVIGEWPAAYVQRRAEAKSQRWRAVELEWRRNLPHLRETLRAMAAARPKESFVLGLVEDGMWEARMWLPVALLAETAWQPDLPSDQLERRVAGTRDAFSLC